MEEKVILVAEASQASTSIKLFNIFRIEERVLIQHSRLERKNCFRVQAFSLQQQS